MLFFLLGVFVGAAIPIGLLVMALKDFNPTFRR